MRGYKRIRVFPDRDLRATRLEMAVIDCRVMQRLRDVRQLGQSFVTFPTAEHSRFSHALGALYWSSKMISYLRENYFSKGNIALLEEANKTLKRTVLKGYADEESVEYELNWFDQLIRLAALLHDVSHLPFGHTLEDQAGLLPRHDEDLDRIDWIFSNLGEEIKDSPHLKGDHGNEYRNVLQILLQQCKALYTVGIILKDEQPKLKLVKKDAAETIDGRGASQSTDIDKAFLPYLVAAYDIVNNTICADLFDYLQRDTLQCGMPWTLDKALFSHLKLVRRQPPYNKDYLRLGVAVGRNGKLRHDVITAVLGLLRTRYDITEKVYYHHTKCAADAMLEKSIRSSELELQWKTILEKDLGDEGLMHELEAQFSGNQEALSTLKALRSRRFHKPVYRLRKAMDWSAKTKDKVSDCSEPGNRTQLEREISEKCKIPFEAVIVSCLPQKMQLKEAQALVEWTDGEVLTLAELPEKKHYLPEVKSLTDRYLDLWSLTVYLDESFENYAGSVESVCERIFDRHNDHLTAEYIKKRYPKAFEVRDLLDQFVEQTEVAVVQDLNVAYKGGSPTGERDVTEVVIDHIESGASRLRKNFVAKGSKGRKRKTSEEPLLDEANKQSANVDVEKS